MRYFARSLALALGLAGMLGCQRRAPGVGGGSAGAAGPLVTDAPRAHPAGAPSAESTPPGGHVPAAAAVKFAAASNQLGFDLYRRVATRSTGDLVLSPASLDFALGLLLGGARGVTADELRRVMHLGEPTGEVVRVGGALAERLAASARPNHFRSANRLFGERGYTFDAGYLELTERAYGAPLERLDFRAAPEPARALINRWVAERTEQRIRELVPRGGVSPETRLALVNAVYFLGQWATPFPKSATRPTPFDAGGGAAKEVPTMQVVGDYRLATSSPELTALALPYAGGAFSFLILLPRAKGGLAGLEAWLSEPAWQKLLADLKPARVAVSLPRFTIDPPESLELAQELGAIGLRSLFDRERADLTGIANPPNPAERLYLSAVFHKAFIRVDETGTEAAAATALTVTEGAAPAPPPLEFKADHPFLFALYDHASGLVLFAGRVVEPKG
ncbi:MAG: serpin family protein [Sorangiineae bacterium]|nr:serpin family protein [Polyangiaceae bacterium]MEB2323649.1 serpin family protein [Sorangiineae bacterium]